MRGGATGLRPSRARRLILAETDSTNAEAARQAAAGEPGPLWILAHRQTAGRASRGRSWSGAEGNLAATLLIRPALGAAEAARLTFAASLAVGEVAGALCPGAAVTLKWPNDVLVEGRKLAGILLESAGQGARLDWLAIGIGVNLATVPTDIVPRRGATLPTCLAEHGAAIAPEAFLDRLSGALEGWLDIHEAEGFAPIRAAWLARAACLGQPIGAGLPAERLEGVFEDVDEAGHLVLHTAAGQRRIAAAEIFFPE